MSLLRMMWPYPSRVTWICWIFFSKVIKQGNFEPSGSRVALFRGHRPKQNKKRKRRNIWNRVDCLRSEKKNRKKRLVHTSQVAGRTQPAADICVCNVRALRKRIPLKTGNLSCFVKLKSVLFNLLCIFEGIYVQSDFPPLTEDIAELGRLLLM